jgi:hypothetical protein
MWSAAFAEAGRRAAVLDEEGAIHFWSLEHEVPRFLETISPPGLQSGRCVALSTDGSRAYCGDDDGNVLALEKFGGRFEPAWLRRVHRDSVYNLQPIHDGRDLLTCGLDARVSILDAGNGLDRKPPYFPELPAERLAVDGLRVRASALEEQDRRFLARRGAVLVGS